MEITKGVIRWRGNWLVGSQRMDGTVTDASIIAKISHLESLGILGLFIGVLSIVAGGLLLAMRLVIVGPGKYFLMDLKQPSQFGDRLRMVVDTKVDVAVILAVARFVANNENRRGLLTSFVAAGFFAGSEGSQDPIG